MDRASIAIASDFEKGLGFRGSSFVGSGWCDCATPVACVSLVGRDRQPQ